MHLITRLLARFLLICPALLLIALGATAFIAQRDIRSETSAGMQVGHVIATLNQLQHGADLAQQVKAIDAINHGGLLRHFHVALYLPDGPRLTARPTNDDERAILDWLAGTMVHGAVMKPFRLSLARPDGQMPTAELVPDPCSEAGEKSGAPSCP